MPLLGNLQVHVRWHQLFVFAGFGYCPAASQVFVEEAAGLGADVRFSEAVTDFRMDASAAGPARVAGEALLHGHVHVALALKPHLN
jgi:hypothetical protein